MTIKDIARLAGCSVGTVSRVLNHHPCVSDSTRRRVMDVVEEQGFQLNNNAKHLKQQAGTGIALLVKGTLNMLFADLVERIERLLQERDWDMRIYYLDEEEDEVAYAGRLCRERRPLGILFLGGDLEHFQAGFQGVDVPCVLLTSHAGGLDLPNLSSLSTDDEEAAFQTVSRLMAEGHRRIGVLGGSWGSSQISDLRLRGCRRAFEARGLPFDAALQTEPSRYSMEEAYRATGRLVERCPGLTAIFAMSDVMAVGALRALRDMGLRVPEDISLVGFDGVIIARFCVPRLNTVCQDADKLARRGVEILLDSIDGGRPPVHEYVPFRLVEGESVRRIEAEQGPTP